MKKDKFVLFYVYGDGEDTPYLVRNPPRNFKRLLRRWNELDGRYLLDDLRQDERWEPINVWLKKQGVEIRLVERIYLDDYT